MSGEMFSFGKEVLVDAMGGMVAALILGIIGLTWRALRKRPATPAQAQAQAVPPHTEAPYNTAYTSAPSYTPPAEKRKRTPQAGEGNPRAIRAIIAAFSSFFLWFMGPFAVMALPAAALGVWWGLRSFGLRGGRAAGIFGIVIGALHLCTFCAFISLYLYTIYDSYYGSGYAYPYYGY